MTRPPRWYAVIPMALAGLLLFGACAGPAATVTSPLHYLIANGEEDVDNTYLSVVRVRVPGRGNCSGVLAGPHLVLTAAHCFCSPAPGTLEANRFYSVSRQSRETWVGLNCSQTAEISTTLYHSGGSSSLLFEGPVRVQIHEGYNFQTNDVPEVIRSEVDLAAVYLGSSFSDLKPGGNMPEREVSAAEFVVAAGYGPKAPQELPAGRLFGTAKVLDLDLQSGRDRVFAFGKREVPLRNVYALKGDSGGPCFRESPDKRRWLIGIISTGTDLKGSPITLFTSTFHHRAWIQLQRELSDEFAGTR